MIAFHLVHLCCAMVPPGMARVFTKHKQVIVSALCPMGMGGDVVLVSIGEALCCWWSPQIASFFLIVCAPSAAGRQYRCRQCWVTLGLCYAIRGTIIKNYKRSPRSVVLSFCSGVPLGHLTFFWVPPLRLQSQLCHQGTIFATLNWLTGAFFYLLGNVFQGLLIVYHVLCHSYHYIKCIINTINKAINDGKTKWYL